MIIVTRQGHLPPLSILPTAFESQMQQTVCYACPCGGLGFGKARQHMSVGLQAAPEEALGSMCIPETQFIYHSVVTGCDLYILFILRNALEVKIKNEREGLPTTQGWSEA